MHRLGCLVGPAVAVASMAKALELADTWGQAAFGMAVSGARMGWLGDTAATAVLIVISGVLLVAGIMTPALMGLIEHEDRKEAKWPLIIGVILGALTALLIVIEWQVTGADFGAGLLRLPNLFSNWSTL